MNLTYGDLPNKAVCGKLTQISFSTPRKNLEIYRLVLALQPYQDAFENEKRKLFVKLGEPAPDDPNKLIIQQEDNIKQYKLELQELTNTEITDFKADFSLSDEDFADYACNYPQDKNMWLNAAEIGTLIKFAEKCKED